MRPPLAATSGCLFGVRGGEGKVAWLGETQKQIAQQVEAKLHGAWQALGVGCGGTAAWQGMLAPAAQHAVQCK